jgi:hypothetical protein
MEDERRESVVLFFIGSGEENVKWERSEHFAGVNFPKFKIFGAGCGEKWIGVGKM